MYVYLVELGVMTLICFVVTLIYYTVYISFGYAIKIGKLCMLAAGVTL